MYTLFLDTHNDKIITILYQNNTIKIKKEISTNHDHSITTMPIIIETLQEAKIETQDLNEIIIVNGPGSFTGIRIGVTIAKTLAYTLQIPIKVMSSLLIKAISFSHENINIIEREKNGIFVGEFNKENRLINDYQYLKNSEYESLNPLSNYIKNIEVDYEKVIKFAKQMESCNPHAVKPLYIKKIEVQK